MDLGRLIEKKLQEAREAGDFDHLPKRAALNLSDDDGVPEDERLAMHLLKSNGFLPDWIEDDKALRDKLHAARSALVQAYVWRRRKLAAAEDAAERTRIEWSWKMARERFEASVAEINTDIFNFNLRAPSLVVHRMPLRVSEEYARLDEEITGNQ